MRAAFRNDVARIDALRGIAALAVALYHARTDLWVGWAAIQANPETFSFADRILSWLGVPMRFMGAGVLLFFVISGFCIHSPQASRSEGEKGEGPHWGKFLIRRMLRIYPPYLVALVLSGLVLAGVQGWSVEGGNRLLASLTLLQNYWPPGGQISSNPSLWSLPVEMELYLVYPLAWWLGRKIGWTWVLVFAVMVSLVGQLLSLRGVRWLDASFPRFWALWCAGAWVAERCCREGLPGWNWRWGLGLAVTLLAASASEAVATIHGLSIWLWGLVGVLALIWAAGPRKSSETLPSGWVPLAAWVGALSYSFYLIHYPVFHWAGEIWRRQFGAKPTSLAVPLAGVLLVIPLAWLFHRWIEAPSHRLARRMGRASKLVAGRPLPSDF